jgi:signal transduction histidine kinase
MYFLARLAPIALYLLIRSTLLAQVPGGAIHGVVHDTTGAVLTKASLRISQLQSGGGRVVGADAYGGYYITNLEPGDYQIEAFAPGFSTEVKHLTLRVGDHLTINFQLRPGSVEKQVLVRGKTSGINTSEFAVKGSVNQVQIQNLPLNGRSFLELARLEPTVRWLTARGRFYYASNGDAERMVGMSVDITDRKLAEEALATVGRRLIEAHEEERTWIGRELHDDINQRLALLAVELDQWRKQSSLDDHTLDRFRHAQQRISEIATDVQALSHRLHSSKLDYLGLARAAKSFCKELSEKAKVEIIFNHAELPSTLPKEVSLCLFRVMQEALQNAVKYTGVQSFEVDLRGTPDSIELTVADTGRGFEVQDALSRQGLGLISMRERLQMVHGELKLQSKAGAGTTIYARVPLKTRDYRAMAS